MANLVDFIIRLKDLASAPMMKMGQTGQKSFTQMETAVSRFQTKLNGLSMNIGQINTRMDELRRIRQISFDTSQIGRINRELDGLQRKKDRLEGIGTRGGMKGSFGSGLAIAGIAGLSFIGGRMIESGVQRQISQTGLETLVGKGPGDLLNRQLVNYATKSIYGNEIMNEGLLMAGSGVSARNVMPVLKMIGDLAIGDKERMKSIALAFSEASSTGYLTGRQELMMRTALFNPLEALAAVTHKTGGQLKKDMEKGKIGIDLLVQAMEYATGPMGRWNHMQDNLAKTGAGQWIAFKGALTTLAGTIGQHLLPALGAVASFLTKVIENKAALYTIAIAIGSITAAWWAYTAAVKVAAIWTMFEKFTANPFLWVAVSAGAVVAIGGIIAAMNNLSSTTGPEIDSLTDKNRQYGKSMVDAANDVNTSVDSIINKMAQWSKISSFYINGQLINKGQDPASFLNQKFGDSWWSNSGVTPGTLAYKLLAQKKFTDYVEQQRKLQQSLKGMPGFRSVDLSRVPFASPLNFNTSGTLLDDKYHSQGGGTGSETLGADTTSTITGGGVRNITINVNKEMVSKIELHSVNIKEGVEEIEELINEVFLRIVNSAATALS